MDLLGCLAAYFQNSDTDLERREGREGVEKGGREGGGGKRYKSIQSDSDLRGGGEVEEGVYGCRGYQSISSM